MERGHSIHQGEVAGNEKFRCFQIAFTGCGHKCARKASTKPTAASPGLGQRRDQNPRKNVPVAGPVLAGEPKEYFFGGRGGVLQNQRVTSGWTRTKGLGVTGLRQRMRRCAALPP